MYVPLIYLAILDYFGQLISEAMCISFVPINFYRPYTRFFYKQKFYKQRRAEIDLKNKEMLSNTLRLIVCYLKIIHIVHPCYHPKVIGHILKNKRKNKCIYIHEIIQLVLMKVRMKSRLLSWYPYVLSNT